MTTTKLSEMIREGAKQTLPEKSRLLRSDDEGRVYTCAIGAACVVASNMKLTDLIQAFRDKRANIIALYCEDLHRILMNTPRITVQRTGTSLDGEKDTVYSLVTRLNDQYNWSREQIADWLEGIGL